MSTEQSAPSEYKYPRITIQYCTQCKWMLRAAYFAQELLSTFSTALGEVALQPATGGIFRVSIETANSPVSGREAADIGEDGGQGSMHLLWDRKTEGGFPEVKELKRRVRDVVEPERALGHVDRGVTKTQAEEGAKTNQKGELARNDDDNEKGKGKDAACEDCK